MTESPSTPFNPAAAHYTDAMRRQRLTRRRGGAWHRWVAVGLFFLLAWYLQASPADRCDDHPQEHPPICHLLCSDDCATAPLPQAPAAPPADRLPGPVYALDAPAALPWVDLEPEVNPPRG